MDNSKLDMLLEKANFIRKDVVDICVQNNAGHIAPSLSAIDILVCLYYDVMSLKENPDWEDRDRLVFSKAHGAYGLYAILSDKGYIPENEWKSFYNGGCLPGCVERDVKHGIEASCGSLGHGLPMATGIAFAAKMLKKDFFVYCIIGDGEMQEGSNWEAIQFAVKHELNNLVLIVDNNNLQAMDFVENVLVVKNRKDDLSRKLNAFGFEVDVCDGHSIEKIMKVLDKSNQVKRDRPTAIIAETIKGYGLLCMENVPKFHFRIPTEEELKLGKRYE